jgi:hypothetical protein
MWNLEEETEDPIDLRKLPSTIRYKGLQKMKQKRKPSERNTWIGRYIKQFGVSLAEASNAYKEKGNKKESLIGTKLVDVPAEIIEEIKEKEDLRGISNKFRSALKRQGWPQSEITKAWEKYKKEEMI